MNNQTTTPNNTSEITELSFDALDLVHGAGAVDDWGYSNPTPATPTNP